MGNAIRVLIVEDEAIVAMQLEMNLSTRGYQTCGPISSGEKAIIYAKEQKPDLILMDRRLTGNMDGLAASRKIREFSDAPIIILSGYLDENLEEILGDLQPAAYLVKPVQAYEIDNTIRKILEDVE
jgi:DNA-binding response OmpR family regulator